MTVGFVTENHCLDAEVTLAGGVSFFADCARNLYADGEPAADLEAVTDWRPTRRYRSENHACFQVLLFDFGAPKAVDLVALLALNLTAAGRVELALDLTEDFTTPLWEGAATPDTDQEGLVFALPSQVTARYLKIALGDASRDYLELGLAIAGEVQQPAYDLATGGQRGWQDGSKVTQAQQAGVAVARRQPRRLWSLPFAVVEQSDADALFTALGGDNGQSLPLLCLEDWTTAADLYAGPWIYGLLSQGVTLKNLFKDHWSSSLQILELPGRPGSGEGALGSASLALDSTAVDFSPGDPVEVGATVDQIVCLSAGTENLGLESGVATVTGTACELVGEGAFNLLAGQTKDLTLRFAPTVQGEDQAGNLTIEHAASGTASPLIIPLTGSALFTPKFAILSGAQTNSARMKLIDSGHTVEVTNQGSGSGHEWPAAYFSGADIANATDKTYWEVQVVALGFGSAGERLQIGFARAGRNPSYSAALGHQSELDWGLRDDGKTYIAGSLSGSAITTALVALDVIGIAQDPVARKAWLRKNGVWLGSGDPENGLNPSFTWADEADNAIRPAATLLEYTTEVAFNFGETALSDPAPVGWLPGHGENLSNL